MNLLDVIAAWMHREPSAVIYLLLCCLIAIQTYMIFGR